MADQRRDDGEQDQIRMAREALAAARADARAKGNSPRGFRLVDQASDQASPADRSSPAAEPAAGKTGGDQPAEADRSGEPGRPTGSRRGQSLRRVRREDPQPLGAAIESLLDDEGWGLAAATGSVFGRWAQIVGPDLAGHTQPESLQDGELVVLADSTAWATQLRLLAAQLLRRLNAELGAGAVQRVKVRGPVSVTRRPGEWRVKGSRGPRDTYG